MPNISIIPISLYIHIPWCVKKCPYCDFNSHEINNTIDYSGYVDALLADAKSQQQFLQGRKITAIFFGGGTPSLLPTKELKRLLDQLQHILDIAPSAEITLEANPATVEHSPFAEYLEAGINRLSLGVQTFSEQKLHGLGRIHSSSEAVNAVNNAQQAGFKRINIDLMHGLPNQSVDEAIFDIKTALSLQPEHISWYQLTIEKNTAFYNQQPILPVDEALADIQANGEQLLKDAGYRNYEVSAWTKDQASVHNMNYWQFGDYLAIGAGAHGKVSLINPTTNVLEIWRYQKTRLPKDYVAHTPAKHLQFKPVSADTLVFEFMMNALRLKQGVHSDIFVQRTGLDLAKISAVITKLIDKELIHKNWQQHLKCTDLGFNYLNYVLQAFDV